ncbi:MAG: class I SAM-dependent methyltransferase [Saprospiraceae bacterium]|nr:class I SAM-dependent methyltransferase [Saprospiraceae bacterium]
MTAESDYIAINKHSWNNRTDVHLKSDFYDVPGFLTGKSSLNSIELDLLGDVKGKSILHLQCHFGQDTISLARMGAKATGIDLADKAIESAKQLATQTGVAASFICCNVYDLPNYLDQQFDLVFTSYGTITWLPDLDKWAKIIARFLKPGGKFIFVEFHPVVWMFDDDFEKVGYNYFNAGPIVETESGTYADKSANIVQESVCWNHGTSEVLNSLISNGLEINSFNEYDYSPYNCFRKTIEFEPRKYRIEHLGNNIPMVFSVVATKKP